MSLRPILVALIFTATAIPVHAHEFWISPEAYVFKNGTKMQAHLRVGQEFEGASYSYNADRFERFEILRAETTAAVDGRLGDRPAFSVTAEDSGLAIVVHETSDSRLTYTDWQKFVKFATHKDFTSVLDDHESRGLTKEKFVELYRRYGKSLLAIDGGNGTDREVGMRTEIVALANPYTDKLTDLPVKVLFEGNARTNAQVELFEREPNGAVNITLHRTDSSGVAKLPVKPGHEYLVDAVTMLPLEADNPEIDPVWYSLWASLTFKMAE